MKTSKIAVILLSTLVSQGLTACSLIKKKSSPAAATSSAATVVEDRSAFLIGYWKNGECEAISTGINTGLYQASVIQVQQNSAALRGLTFLDAGCTQPLIEQTPLVSFVVKLVGPFTSDANLVGVNVTNSDNGSIMYTSGLIEGNQLRMASSEGGADEAHRAVATSSDTALPRVVAPTTFSVSDEIALTGKYLFPCSNLDGKFVTYDLQFDQAGKKMTTLMKVYDNGTCSGLPTLTGPGPDLEYTSLFLKSTTYGEHTEIQGSAPRDGDTNLYFRFVNGVLKIDGLADTTLEFIEII